MNGGNIMRRIVHLLPIALFMAILFMATQASEAAQTKITVRARAIDAKFVGSKMGGVQITIKDAENGKVLAEGKIEGDTGDGKLIMETPVKRGDSIVDAKTAKFDAVVDISEPRLVTIEAVGPLGWKQSSEKVSTQLWVIPGKDLTGGDGIVLEFYGFAMDFTNPKDNTVVALSGGKAEVGIKAMIAMI
jgi:hypothetical protein